MSDFVPNEPASTTDACKFADCGEQTSTLCHDCCAPYCANCASPLDPNFCKTCLPVDSAEIVIEEPLKDFDGVCHDGRDLKPTGSAFRSNAQHLIEMTDFQLGAYLDRMVVLVHEAERVLDYRRIALGAAKIEKSDRDEAKRRRLRQAPRIIVNGENITKQVKAPKATASSVADVLKKAGITKEMIAAIIAAKQAKGGGK